MFRKLKALGLALTAIAALSALVAPSAQAGTLDIGADPAILTGASEGEQILTVRKQTPQEGGDFTAICQSAAFESTIEQDGSGSQQVQEATITPTYGNSESTSNGCQLFGQQAQVRLNGCKYTLTGSGQAANTFLVDIVGCTPGKQITIQAASCQLIIPEQNGLSHMVSKTLEGSPDKATLEATLSGITHTQIGAGCPDGNNHHGIKASIAGSTTIEAREDGGTKQVTVKGHQYQQHSGHGAGFAIAADPAVITGLSEGQQQFKFERKTSEAGKTFTADCESASFEGTVAQNGAGSQQAQDVTLAARYGSAETTPTGCQFNGSQAHVKMGGCKYTLTGAGQPENTFLVDIVGCMAGEQITIQTFTCQVVIPEQTGLSHVVAKNVEGSPHEVTLQATISGITYQQIGSGCPEGNNHHSSNGTLTGSAVFGASGETGTQEATLDIAVDPAVLTGTNEKQHQFRIKKQTSEPLSTLNIDCQSASFEATAAQDEEGSQKVQEITITPTYGKATAPTNCVYLGIAIVVIKMNGCKYTLTGAGQPVNTFTMDIVGCTAGQQITIQTVGCQYRIPEQNGLSHVVTKSIAGNPHEVTIEMTIGGITHTHFGSGCPEGSGHHSTTMALTGSTILKAYEDLGAQQITRKSHQYSELVDGDQVDVTPSTVITEAVDITSTTIGEQVSLTST